MSIVAMLPAALDESKLDRLQRLEAKIGATVVALETESPYAKLTDEQVNELKSVEDDLGVVLVAYRPN